MSDMTGHDTLLFDTRSDNLFGVFDLFAERNFLPLQLVLLGLHVGLKFAHVGVDDHLRLHLRQLLLQHLQLGLSPSQEGEEEKRTRSWINEEEGERGMRRKEEGEEK